LPEKGLNLFKALGPCGIWPRTSSARSCPACVDGLRAAHAGFGRTVEENRIVLATARAVSEGLIKSLSEEITRASRPMTYGPATGWGRSAPAEPLVLFRRI
jgi:hypothetical protein